MLHNEIHNKLTLFGFGTLPVHGRKQSVEVFGIVCRVPCMSINWNFYQFITTRLKCFYDQPVEFFVLKWHFFCQFKTHSEFEFSMGCHGRVLNNSTPEFDVSH